jgi:hypothetical protein
VLHDSVTNQECEVVTLNVITVGPSAGIVLTKKALAKVNMPKGNTF